VLRRLLDRLDPRDVERRLRAQIARGLRGDDAEIAPMSGCV
jgi:hypothetical protein